ncbi:MAG: FAD-binding oxidoreductase [Hydrogenophaga sp.]|nr:FAD-binding oxidoreductase [Hydrogenophaga sp.]
MERMMGQTGLDQDLVARIASRLGIRGLVVDSNEIEPYESSARHGSGRACAVVRPATLEDLAWVVNELITAGERVVTQGAATGLVGAASPTVDGTQWILSTQRLRDVLHIDPINRTATVAVGFRLSDLNRQALEHGLTFPIDLGADPTIGGMVATNTGGARLIRYGGVRENLLALRAVLVNPAGQLVGSDKGLRKNNTGLDWTQLLCGSFGAFGIVGRATVKLHPVQRQSATALVAVESAQVAVELACALEQSMGEFVSAFEGMSDGALKAVAHHQGQSVFAEPAPYAVLLEVSSAVATGTGLDLESMLMTWLENRMEQGGILDAIVDKPAQLWRIRHAISEAVQSQGPMVAFDIAVPRSSFASFRDEAKRLIEEFVPDAVLCDFGHIGDGGVHLNMSVPLDTKSTAIESLRVALYDAVVVKFCGSFSAEHGIGPYNQQFYDRYTEEPLRRVCSALQSQLDPALQLGNVRLGGVTVEDWPNV